MSRPSMASILVIDDNPQVAQLTATTLTCAGHRVRSTSDPKSIPRIVEEEPFDVVVTDIEMPAVSGVEVIRELRRDHPEIGVVAMSGGVIGQDSLQAEVQAIGPDAFLEKPFRMEELYASINRALVHTSRRNRAA